MLALPWWASAALGFLAKFANGWLDNRRREQELRDAGAARQKLDSLREAERQEAMARAAGDAASDEPDDPRDLRPD